MRFLSALLLLSALPCPAVQRIHYAYRAGSPNGWTRSASELPAVVPAAPGDYTVYLGAQNEYRIAQIATGGDGDTYVAGSRLFPSTSGGTYTSDVFVAKLDPSGSLQFLATLSGKGTDTANALALDPAGNIYLAGMTDSPNFPLRNAVQAMPALRTGFLVKLSPDGSGLIYSTYFGGMLGLSAVSAVTADAGGNAYVTGTTSSPDFPHPPGTPPWSVYPTGTSEVDGAFVAKISPDGSQVLNPDVILGRVAACCCGTSCFLSPKRTEGIGIRLDAAGNLFVAGNSNTLDAAAPPAGATEGLGAWVAHYKPDGTRVYAEYLDSTRILGGISGTTATAFALDGAGNLYLAGMTRSSRFPATPGAFQTERAGPPAPDEQLPPSDAFAAKLSPEANLLWASYLGGSANETANTIATNAAGNVWVGGFTDSSDFPNANGWTTGSDFMVEFNALGTALQYSARYPQGTASQSLAIDGSGVLHMAGKNGLVSAMPPAQQLSARVFGIMNAAGGTVAGRIAPAEMITILGPKIGPQQSVAAVVENGRLPTMLAGLQVLIGGIPAPLIDASANQIRAIAPFGLTGIDTANITVSSSAAAMPDFKVAVAPVQPGIFSPAMNQDGSSNSADHPAALGSIVAIWLTGVDPGIVTPVDGTIQTSAQQSYCCQVKVGDKDAEVLYAGTAPGLAAGAWQVNFRVPDLSQSLYFDSTGKATAVVTVSSRNQAASASISVRR